MIGDFAKIKTNQCAHAQLSCLQRRNPPLQRICGEFTDSFSRNPP